MSLIAGVHRAGDLRPIRSPWSGEVVSEVHFATAPQLEEAVAAAHAIAPEVRRMPAHARVEVLRRMVTLLRERQDELAGIIRDEAAKPWRLALGEARRCVQTFEDAVIECHNLSHGEGVGLDAVPAGDGRFGVVRHFGIGPVLGISPFNFPLNLSAHKLAPALAAGCPVVLKPASQTPSAALILGEIAVEAGWPEAAISVVPTTRAAADGLIEDPRFRVITFTGSPAVGWGLKARAGQKRVVLELGGNAAAIVAADADLDAAVSRLATGSFAYSGQVCISVQRILAHADIYEEFVDRLVRETEARHPVVAPEHPTGLVSALIDAGNAQRVQDWVAEAVEQGATLRCGGERTGNALTPMVLTDVDPRAKVADREAFGPLVVVAPFADWDEAIHMANDTRYGLQCGVYTSDVKAVWRCFEEIEVGAVIHDDYPTYRVDLMPYGGVKSSGFGREGLRWSIRDMTEERLLALRTR